jgi:hypothetical protein
MQNTSIGIGISAWTWMLFQYNQQFIITVFVVLTAILLIWILYRAQLLPQLIIDAIDNVLKTRGSHRIELDVE